jgi:NADPH:quinone reductase-like Zn-dependent oxidoreductase
MDVAGIVDKLGEGTDGRLAVGDSVIAYVNPIGPHGGAYAEKVVVEEASVVHAPSGASFAEAATLLLNATTARLSLDALDLPSGSTVAVIGGAGAVGDTRYSSRKRMAWQYWQSQHRVTQRLYEA